MDASVHLCTEQRTMEMDRIFLLLAAAGLVLACNPQSYFEKRGEAVDTGTNTLTHGMIVLGDKLQDPYSVDNMTKALNSLYPTKAGEVTVPTTNLYVRFLPADDGEYELLRSLGVEMLDHPVDYEIVTEGDYYQDPDIPEDEITWQYAVVAPDFVFPEGIRYEILDRCHIAEANASTRADGIDWEAVERESFRLTGNEDMLLPVTRGDGAAAEGIKPSGRITILDETSGKVRGVANVRVSCNVFVKFSRTFTDEDGYYQMKRSFTSDPRYRLVFRNQKGFGIGMNLLLYPASVSTLGKGSNEGISVDIDSSSDAALFRRCVVNNAAWDYINACKSDDGTIKLPPSNLRIWILGRLGASSAVMMQQGAGIDNGMIKEYLGEYTKLLKMFLPDITLGLKDCRDYASIYSVTVHEMAHASHFMQAKVEWWDVLINYIMKNYVTSGGVTYGIGTEADHGYCEVAEMWAYYMQSRMYHDRYGGPDVLFGTSSWFYPQIFYDMDKRGVNRYKIFKALDDKVCDRDELQERLVTLYPESKTTILSAFNRYK